MKLDEIYNKCILEQNFILQENIDYNKIKSMLEISEQDYIAAIFLKNHNPIPWSTIYKLHYDTIHILTEAFLSFDKVKSSNHQCLFVFLCTKHPELDFDWIFFEKIRTKRNGINYHGIYVNFQDYREIEVQINLYISTLKKSIFDKLKDI